MGHALGGRAPEFGVAGGAGEEEEFGGGCGQWIVLEDDRSTLQQARQGYTVLWRALSGTTTALAVCAAGAMLLGSRPIEAQA
ncbi:hypothetical protein D3C81_2159510 [compost metagenome]